MVNSRFLRPQNILIYLLSFLYALALGSGGEISFALSSFSILAALSLGYLLPYAIQRARGLSSRMRWENALITLLILILLVDQRLALPWAAVLGLVTAMLKMSLRWQGRPIFNPAASGFVAVYVLGIFNTWWGVSFSPRFSEFMISVAVFLTVPVAAYVAKQYHKLEITTALLACFALVSLLLTQSVPWIILLEGTLLFFALVMATEPLTTPTLMKEKWVFGGLIGGLVAWFVAQGWPLPYCLPLILVNLGYFLYRWFSFRQKRAQVTKTSPVVPVTQPTPSTK